jgi:hypothetical protein
MRIPRATVAIFATVGLALLAAACGSTSGHHVARSGSSSSQSGRGQALAYARCMRTHGVASYPDPNSNGDLSKGGAEAFGVSASQYQTAEQDCGRLLPAGGSASLTQCLMTGDCPQSVVQPAMAEGLKFAQCMRSHGVSDWPDPAIDSIGRPSFRVTRAGISIDSTRSPQMLSKIGDCQRVPGAVLLRQE